MIKECRDQIKELSISNQPNRKAKIVHQKKLMRHSRKRKSTRVRKLGLSCLRKVIRILLFFMLVSIIEGRRIALVNFKR